MKKITIILAILVFSNTMFSQDSKSDILLKADKALKEFDFSKAEKYFKDELTANLNSTQAYEGLIKTYTLSGNTEKLTESFEALQNSGNMSDKMKLLYANFLNQSQKYSQAAKLYSEVYPTKGFNDSYFKTISTNNGRYKIAPVDPVNSKYSDFAPMFYKDNGLIYISTNKERSRTGFFDVNDIKNLFTDIFWSKYDTKTSKYTKGNSLILNPDLRYMQGPVSFANNYGVMYITRSIAKDDKAIKSDDNKIVNLEICRVQQDAKNEGYWNKVTPIVFKMAENQESFKNYSYAHPALTRDGKSMIFASNMPGGMGGTDLWRVNLVGEDWGTPENLGPEINTPGEELYPYISDDNNLYFASSGLPGLGGLDVFKAKINGTVDNNPTFSNVTNLGSPINSKFDDFGFIIDRENKKGFFSSNSTERGTSAAQDNIYSWESTEQKIVVKVLSAATKEPINTASVNIPCLPVNSYSTDKMGQVVLNVPSMENCKITASKEGYKTNFVNVVDVKGKKVIEILLEKEYDPKIKMIVYVYDKETRELIPQANVDVKKVSSGASIAGVTDVNGRLVVNGVDPNEFYDLVGGKQFADGSRYLTSSESANTRGIVPPDSVIVKLYLLKGSVGKKFRIDNIYYDLNKWFIRPEAARELDNIVNIMYQNPTMRIELSSHTDCRATYKYNEDLSQKRANAAVEYIVTKGVDASRLISKGYGESQLVNGCACEGTVKSTCTEEEHQENRRTEFKILNF